ncbi:hypothetical protein ACVBEH_01030 [Roseateles sp. GG27B]
MLPILRSSADSQSAFDAPTQQNRADVPAPYVSSEFERYVQRAAGDTTDIRRFGAELMSTTGRSGIAQEAAARSRKTMSSASATRSWSRCGVRSMLTCA